MARSERDLEQTLREDLATVLRTAVDPADLLPRPDGAAAPLLGLIGVAAPATRQIACRMLTEWVQAGTAELGQAPQLWGPLPLEVSALRVGEESLLPGMSLRALPAGLPPRQALEHLLPTAAALAGAMRRVVLVERARAAYVPGWTARLRLLAEYDVLGPAEKAADPGAWAVAAHQLVASVFVPEAAEGSVWSLLVTAVQERALGALTELGEAQEGEGELDRRGSADFNALVDMERSATLDDHPSRSGNVLQVVRLPRRRGDRLEKAVVLLAPRGGA